MGAGLLTREATPAGRMVRVAELEAEGARLVGVVNASAARLVGVVAQALAEGVWECDGIRSPQHWVSLRFGMSSARAARLVAAAEVLPAMPRVREAFVAGEIGEDHVVEVARAGVHPSADEEVAGLAREATVSQLRRGLSYLPRVEDATEGPSQPAPDPVDRRRVGFGQGELSGWGLHAAGLDEAEGALVERALTAARDDLFRARHGLGPEDEVAQALAGEISWADALVRMAEVALDGCDPASASGRPPSERYLVNIHLRADQVDPWASIHLGPALPRWLRREVACGAQVRLWVTDNTGTANLGRRQRVVDPRLRAVVEHRDGGCVVPGCGARRHLVVHHIEHWEGGGATDTANLVALCRAHHRLVHQGGPCLAGNPDLGSLVCTDRDGLPLASTPAVPPPGGDPHAGASELGLPDEGWTPRAGERAEWRWIAWRGPTGAAPGPDRDEASTDSGGWWDGISDVPDESGSDPPPAARSDADIAVDGRGRGPSPPEAAPTGADPRSGGHPEVPRGA
jgi:hypothetical protein